MVALMLSQALLRIPIPTKASRTQPQRRRLDDDSNDDGGVSIAIGSRAFDSFLAEDELGRLAINDKLVAQHHGQILFLGQNWDRLQLRYWTVLDMGKPSTSSVLQDVWCSLVAVRTSPANKLPFGRTRSIATFNEWSHPPSQGAPPRLGA